MKDEIIVMDTNVLLSALKSKKGYSYQLLQKIINDEVKIAISVALILEYESILKRYLDKVLFSDFDIEEIINYLCLIGKKTKIFYLWRPYLKDYFDDHVLEVAINADCTKIVTFNIKDFQDVDKLGIQVMTPKEFLMN
jgi:putative PIN family toxin of toxin-antitoxin system